MPGLQDRSPVGGTREATTHWCFSPSFSFPSPLSKNKFKNLFKKLKEDFIYSFFREKGERESSMCERNTDLLPLPHAPTLPQLGITCTPDMWPHEELNQWAFTLQDIGQPTEPHWSMLILRFKRDLSDLWNKVINVKNHGLKFFIKF